jgi:hypothetical protein
MGVELKDVIYWGLFPGLMLESCAFDEKHPLKDTGLNQVLTRIAAIAAPILDVVQLLTCPLILLITRVSMLFSDKEDVKAFDELALQALKSTVMELLPKSIMQMPQRLWYGCSPKTTTPNPPQQKESRSHCSLSSSSLSSSSPQSSAPLLSASGYPDDFLSALRAQQASTPHN